MIETWIDTLIDVWRTVECPGFATIKTPYLVRENRFPSAVTPSNDFPISITIPGTLDVQYSEGGPKIGFFTGVTQFHVTPDRSMAHMPALMPWYGAIWRAAALHMTLGGLVEYFVINKDNGIIGPLALQYGDEIPHWGFLVNWTVKEKNNNTVAVGR
jgi:hypothetical protein